MSQGSIVRQASYAPLQTQNKTRLEYRSGLTFAIASLKTVFSITILGYFQVVLLIDKYINLKI
ncbi:hypothetical protein H6G96_00845 [Nostoc sp. FACHB-892]|uniref:hypothetical protein n=1 Tax=Nostoc sp. FACHB-892 TaxID=2692843 RepID=UPI0016841747|nr:hypothetical protein [Nostoc sp. FACHB-892]MBD2724901.1 hypothetical protein [Nostoc sp. FACHB-892]